MAATITGFKLILFGLLLKVVVADNLGPTVDSIFSNYENLNGGVLALGTIYFAFQIYGDFCGYSTIAIGVAKILGVELMTNFETPYFSTSIKEFWRRWHISLSSFFKDYVYIPLGGARVSTFRKWKNLNTTFLLSGVWHGANWTFILWGGLHGLALSIHDFLSTILPRTYSRAVAVFLWALTFSIVCVGWIFFRSESISDAFAYIHLMLSQMAVPNAHRMAVMYVVLGIALDTLWRHNIKLDKPLLRLTIPMGTAPVPRIFSELLYTTLIWILLTNWFTNNASDFIYFQF